MFSTITATRGETRSKAAPILGSVKAASSYKYLLFIMMRTQAAPDPIPRSLVVRLPSTNAAQRRDLGVVNLKTARSTFLSGGRIRRTQTGISA
jgi:hypothetical protein